MKVLWTQTPGSEEIPFFGELKSLYPDVEFKFAENIGASELKIFGVNYNVLRIAGGLGGLAYIN